MRPGRHSPDDPEEQLARAKLEQGKPEKPKEVVKIKSRGKFSYNGKGR